MGAVGVTAERADPQLHLRPQWVGAVDGRGIDAVGAELDGELHVADDGPAGVARTGLEVAEEAALDLEVSRPGVAGELARDGVALAVEDAVKGVAARADRLPALDGAEVDVAGEGDLGRGLELPKLAPVPGVAESEEFVGRTDGDVLADDDGVIPGRAGAGGGEGGGDERQGPCRAVAAAASGLCGGHDVSPREAGMAGAKRRRSMGTDGGLSTWRRVCQAHALALVRRGGSGG